MPWEEEDQGTIPPHGVSGNDQSDDDADYIVNLTEKSRAKSQTVRDNRFYYGKEPPKAPPFGLIKRALQEADEPHAQPGTTAYFRESLADKGSCPLCIYEDFNRVRLAQHISAHIEVRRYQQFWTSALRDYEGMLERRAEIKEQITVLKGKSAALERLVKKSEKESSPIFKREGDILLCTYCSKFIEEDDEAGMEQHIEQAHIEQLKVAVDRAFQSRNKKELHEMNIERLEVKLKELEARIKKFKTAPDTASVAAGRHAAGDDILDILTPATGRTGSAKITYVEY